MRRILIDERPFYIVKEEFLKELDTFKLKTCPCCGQVAKKYKRSLTGAMAYALILIYKKNKENNNSFFHVEDYLKKIKNIPPSIRGDFPKLRFFNLIEKQKGRRDDGSNRVGYYRITQDGKDFVEMKLKVRKYIILYNNDFLKSDGDYINIKESLKKKFNYTELMETK